MLVFYLSFCIILIIILLYVSCTDKYITGFWLISDQFKEESGLDNFVLYIAPDLSSGYAIISADNKTIFNDNITLKISNSYLHINEDIQSIPKILKIELDKNKGKLTLKNNNIIYGIFYKDNQMSELTTIENN